MINRYKRSARSAKELDLGTFAPMDEAIGELAAEPPAINAAPLGADRLPRDYPGSSGSTGTRTQDQRIKNPLL